MNVIIPAGFEDLKATGKIDVIEEMVKLLVIANEIKPEAQKTVLKAILDRESMGTTGIMNGVGVPHARCDGVRDLICCIGKSAQGVNFESLDDQPVFIFFLLLSSKQHSQEHLAVLAQLSTIMREEKTIKALRSAKSTEEMLDIMNGV